MDEIVESGWREFVAGEFGALTVLDERDVAEIVVDEPDRHLWRVVDAAYDRLVCAECGDRLSRGPAGCTACDLANGFRYVAVEIDRPGVPPGNEHALRVNVSVVRRPSGISWREVLGRRLLLPHLLDGRLPTTRQAQAARALAAYARDNLGRQARRTPWGEGHIAPGRAHQKCERTRHLTQR